MNTKSQPPLTAELLAQYGSGQGVFQWTDGNNDQYIGRIAAIEIPKDGDITITSEWLTRIINVTKVVGDVSDDEHEWEPGKRVYLTYVLRFEDVVVSEMNENCILFRNKDRGSRERKVERFSISTLSKDKVLAEVIYTKCNFPQRFPNPTGKAKTPGS